MICINVSLLYGLLVNVCLFQTVYSEGVNYEEELGRGG